MTIELFSILNILAADVQGLAVKLLMKNIQC